MSKIAKNQIFGLDKFTLFWSVCGLILAALFLVSIFTTFPSRDEVKLIIDYGDGSARKFMTNHREGASAWELLQQANAVYGIPLEVEGHFEPNAIGHKKNGEDGMEWNFYLNGKRAQEPFEAGLSGGDIVLFKFE